MLPDKSRRTLAYRFQQFHLPFHFDSVRWICALKIHSATRRQNAIPILARNSKCVTFVHVWCVRVDPDHEVRAAKLTNRWISGCWWGRDASSDEHLVGTKHGLLKCKSVRRKPPGVEARGTKWNFDVEMDSGIPGPTLQPRRDRNADSDGTEGNSHSTSTCTSVRRART